MTSWTDRFGPHQGHIPGLGVDFFGAASSADARLPSWPSSRWTEDSPVYPPARIDMLARCVNVTSDKKTDADGNKYSFRSWTAEKTQQYLLQMVAELVVAMPPFPEGHPIRNQCQKLYDLTVELRALYAEEPTIKKTITSDDHKTVVAITYPKIGHGRGKHEKPWKDRVEGVWKEVHTTIVSIHNLTKERFEGEDKKDCVPKFSKRIQEAVAEDVANNSGAMSDFTELYRFARQLNPERKNKELTLAELTKDCYKQDRKQLRKQENYGALEQESALLGVLYETRWMMAAEKVNDVIYDTLKKRHSASKLLARANEQERSVL